MGEEVDVTITYLRQRTRPAYAPQPRPPGKIAILRAENPPTHFYRYLYDLVGRKWNWVSRRGHTDDEIAAIINRPDVFLYVLYVDGVPGGMAEINATTQGLVEIQLFGLAPDFIGRGLSRYFFANAVDLAWAQNPKEVLIETSTLDHPAALSLYQKFGFVVVDQRRGRVALLGAEAP